MSARRLAMVAVSGVLLSAACSSSPRHVCSLVSASDGVKVNFDHGMIPRAQTLQLTACINAKCATRTYRAVGHDPEPGPLFTGGAVPAEGVVDVRVTLTADGQAVFVGSTTARTHKLQPNGPSCPPTVWFVRVHAHTGGQLTPT